MAKKPISELLGGVTRFGKLTLIEEGEPLGRMRRGLFRCDCGTEKAMGLHHVRNGLTVSCGCEGARMSASRFTKHGGYLTSEYKSWNAMVQRCTNPNSTSWDDYGGRGITVCERWLGENGFRNFVADMGQRPSGRTLDRIDSDKGYSASNARWATPKTQQNNRRITKMLTYGGETMSQAEWTHRLGLSRNGLGQRLRKGWTLERALTTPPGNSGPKPA